jgi:hypothetical protein
MVKVRVGVLLGPVALTAPDVPGAPVIVLPTVIVAAMPVGPVALVAPVVPVNPIAPVGPVGPWGTVKVRTGAPLGPVELTAPDVPGAPVIALPTVIVAAVPVGPVGPVAPICASKLQFELLPGVPVFPLAVEM